MDHAQEHATAEYQVRLWYLVHDFDSVLDHKTPSNQERKVSLLINNYASGCVTEKAFVSV